MGLHPLESEFGAVGKYIKHIFKEVTYGYESWDFSSPRLC